MTALNPEIIKDTKSLISLYQENNRFKTAFDKIVAKNINATYHGRPVKLYVEVLKNVTSKYKQEYSQVRKIVLHDTEGKIGELFKKVDPDRDFRRLDEAYEAAKKGQNSTNFEKEEIDEINNIEGDSKNNSKEKRKSYERREERIKIQEQEPGKNPENKKSFNPASQEEIARLKTALLPKEAMPAGRQEIPKNILISPTGQALTKPIALPEGPSVNILVGPSGKPIRNIYPESEESRPETYQTPMEIRQESSGYSAPSISLPNIPNSSKLRNFASNSKTFFRGGVKAGGVVAKGAGRVAGTAIKAGAGAAAKLGASALLGAATGGVSLIFTFITSYGTLKDLFKLIFWIVIGLIAFIIVMFIFQRGEKMNSLLPPYDIPTMGPVGPTPPPGDLDKRCNFSAFDIFNTNAVNDDLLKKYTDRAIVSGKIKTSEQRDNLSSRAKYIRDQAQSVGLNPAIFLGYWESESAFSDYSNPGVRPGMDLGCDPLNKELNTFEADVLCAIGKSSVSNSRTSQCAVSKNINSPACQAISFQQAEGVRLPISTLKDFLDSYGSKVADPNNTTSDNIVKQVIVDLGLVQCTTTQNSSTIVSCPLNGDKVISCGSYMSDPKFNIGVCRNPNLSKEVPADRGHCGNFYPICITDRKKHSIDINAQAGEEVKLPTIEGQTVNWSYSATFGPLSNDDGGGYGQIFNTTVNGHQWVIYLIHTVKDLIPSRPNSGYQSGDPVTKIATTPFTHLHVNIGKDPTDANNSPGWLDPELLGMCVNL